mgnify:CR=1 FL=1
MCSWGRPDTKRQDVNWWEPYGCCNDWDCTPCRQAEKRFEELFPHGVDVESLIKEFYWWLKEKKDDLRR